MTEAMYLQMAAGLAALVGVAHSVLGEILIFNRMRRGRFVPTDGGQRLHERHVRILWASWHVVTVFGWALAAILLRLSQSPARPFGPFLIGTVASAMLAGAVLVLIATNGRHPGWLGLLGVAVLAWLSA